MSTEENRAIAHRFAQVWTAGNLHLVDELAAPDIVVSYPHPPEPIRGAEEFKAFLGVVYAGLADAVVTVDEMLAAGDKVACRWTMSATHKGPWFGFPATGKAVQLSGFTFYCMANGKVVEETGMGDALGLLMQMGAEIRPSHSE